MRQADTPDLGSCRSPGIAFAAEGAGPFNIDAYDALSPQRDDAAGAKIGLTFQDRSGYKWSPCSWRFRLRDK
jgi:hypothetical protein